MSSGINNIEEKIAMEVEEILSKHTEEIQEIISKPPNWLIRWGILVYFLFLSVILSLTALIRYPDIVNISLLIKSSKPSKAVATKIPGKLSRILVKNNSYVTAGQPLAIIESTTDANNALNILAKLKLLQTLILENKPTNTFAFDQSKVIELGELQPAFQIFFNDYISYLSGKANTSLTKYRFLQSLNSIISKIEGWENLYILTAPQSGKLAYVDMFQESQLLTPNETLFYINQPGGNLFGEINIPQAVAGKVRIGQQVHIKLRNFPYEEYGGVSGKISSISEIPYKGSFFIAHVSLKSNHLSGKKSIALQTGMPATAEIVTEDLSVFSRITKNLAIKLK